MGSIKKALKPITRVVDNIIPNEIKPALPYLAATFGAPYLAGTGLFTSGIGNIALRKGLAGALTNVGTQALLGKNINPISAAVSGLTIGGGEFIKPANIIGAPTGIQSVLQTAGNFLSPDKIGSPSLATFGEIGKAASVPATAGAIEATQDAAIEANNAYEAYLKEQEDAENQDILTRVDFITRYLTNAGFDQNYIDSRLNELGYAANGGLMNTRVGYKIGGSTLSTLIARALGAEPSNEQLMQYKESRANEIFNEILEPGGNYSPDDLNKAKEKANKMASDELDEYMKKLGMDMMNPPEGSMSDDLINQIMGPREEGRVKEANGGRIGLAGGGDTLGEKMSDMKILIMKNDIIESGKLGFDVKDIDTYSDDKIIEIHESLFGQGNKNGGRIGLALGGMNDPKIPSDNIIDSMIQESTEEEKGIMTTRNDRIGTLMNLLQAEQMSDNPDLDKIMIYKAELADLMGSRTGAAEGGIMNLKMGGMPAEMDLRGGGFVPLGAKERADDVPARLSKNEFVMTADAVRAAGGGSVNKGAKRMYDLMNNLEARV